MTVKVFRTRKDIKTWLTDNDIPEDLANEALTKWETANNDAPSLRQVRATLDMFPNAKK